MSNRGEHSILKTLLIVSVCATVLAVAMTAIIEESRHLSTERAMRLMNLEGAWESPL